MYDHDGLFNLQEKDGFQCDDYLRMYRLFSFHRRVNTLFYPEVLSGNRKLIGETISGWVKEQIVK